MHLLNDTRNNLKNIGPNSVSLDLPFFFNNKDGSFYRFEGTIYNYLKESALKNYSLEVSLNPKSNFKVLRNLFFGAFHATIDKMSSPPLFYSYCSIIVFLLLV